MNPRIDVITCQTGAQRYPGLPERVHEAGGRWSTTECFDRCEQCERFLLARVHGSMMRLGGPDELVNAVGTLAGAGG